MSLNYKESTWVLAWSTWRTIAVWVPFIRWFFFWTIVFLIFSAYILKSAGAILWISLSVLFFFVISIVPGVLAFLQLSSSFLMFFVLPYNISRFSVLSIFFKPVSILVLIIVFKTSLYLDRAIFKHFMTLILHFLNLIFVTSERLLIEKRMSQCFFTWHSLVRI